MVYKNSASEVLAFNEGNEYIKWGDIYSTGIRQIDEQHKQLVILTNQLYHACLAGDDSVGSVFKEAMSRMVEYVRFHFSAEQKLLEQINYPNCKDHKTKHDALIKDILEMAKEYGEGRKFVPNHFVRILKDWVFGHIAVEDKIYSAFVQEQMKRGLLTAGVLENLKVN